MMRAGLTSRQALLVITLWAGFLFHHWGIRRGVLLESVGDDANVYRAVFLYAYSITHAWRVTRFVRRLKRRAKRSKQL